MQIRDVMVRDVQTCTGQDSLNRAAQIMWEHDCGVVPVVDEDQRVVGMITDRDVCMAAYTKGRTLGTIRVDEVMARDVKTCRSEDPVADVEAIMRKQRIRRVPVTDPLDHVMGIVSLNDLARRAMPRGKSANGIGLDEVGETLAGVCRPSCDLAAKAASPARMSAVCGATTAGSLQLAR